MKKQKKDNLVKTQFNSAKEYCSENDITFDWINDRQVRLYYNGIRLDIFPLGKKYHNITTNQRGIYTNLVGLLMTELI
ncbi:MAG: hypothetical protein KA311_00195 [Sediminibacterium sp.]|nr:hypothetical protein [Sediminibacterium sp.]MBP7939504.1 hypothetical protein [Sediminibacterium sp.]